MGDTKISSLSNKHVKVRDLPITWLRKLITMIQLYDTDNDGHGGYEDFMTLADRLIKYGKLDGKAADDVIEFFQSYGSASKAGARSEMMAATGTAQQILAAWKARDNPAAVELWRSKYSRMFKLFDLNSTGFITFDEYLTFWRIFGIDPRFARMQFDYMDTDADGNISEGEFVDAAIDNFCNADLDAPNRFYGPLVKY
ncbi:unnamed protein product [Owenia fusiformis]|uniref:Uncharacterized protein n=1 Tax=Owenia fusiformis TaxID=6347 RepID=A0A8J1TGB1_OWEFU|nr:unnamed protein product [Owenia fusiformis]